MTTSTVRHPVRTAVTWAAIGAVLALGLALRFWHLATSGWQYDEVVYWQVAHSLANQGGLTEHVPYGTPWSPFLYQPPWYPYALAGWFRAFGATVHSGRVLGVIFSLCTLTCSCLLVRRLYGERAALFAIVPIAFDGWLLYIQQVGYIENVILALITAAFLLYQRALDRPSWQRFALAGLAFGVAGCIKYTGLYALLAVVLCWLILRCLHSLHLLALAVAAGVLASDQLILVAWFRHWYINETALQAQRVLGLLPSGGTLTAPGAMVHLLLAQYRVFAASFVVAVAAVTIGIRRLIRCYRVRDWRPVQSQALLFSWSAAGIVTFGFSNLRFPQYFALILLPLYLLCWTTVWNWERSTVVKMLLASLAVIAGVTSFSLSTTAQSDNVLAQVQAYAAEHIPPHAVVVADEMVGDLLRQPYCREQDAKACLHHATYAVTWTTYLQSTFKLGDQAFTEEMAGARPVWSRRGFSATATVWKLRKRPIGPMVGIDVEADSNYPLPLVRQYGRRVMAYIRNRLHAQAAGVVWDLCTPSAHSNIVTRACTLSPHAVRILAAEAKHDGLTVQLRPLIRVGPQSGWNNPKLSWEGYIQPASQRAWFASLLRAELPYLAVLHGVPGSQFVVGTELHGLAGSRYWPSYVRQAQALCGCQVSISAHDHQFAAGLVPPVTAPGVDWYPHLRLSASASQAAVTRAWEASLSRIPRSLLARTSLDEEGIRATVGAYHHPQTWGKDGLSAPQVQERYFIAACRAAAHYQMQAIYFYMIPLNDDPAHPFTFPAYFIGNSGAQAISDCRRAK